MNQSNKETNRKTNKYEYMKEGSDLETNERTEINLMLDTRCDEPERRTMIKLCLINKLDIFVPERSC